MTMNGSEIIRSDQSRNSTSISSFTTKKNDKKKTAHLNNGFKSLGLSDTVYQGIVRMGFRMPTPVQRKALPVILTGVDTVVMARTGSGKTIAFCIPLVEKLLALQNNNTNNNNTTTNKNHHGSSVKGIILSPTRELSQQTLRVLNKLLGPSSNIKCIGITGAESMEHQFHLLSTKPDVIVATPGRLAHHLTEIPDFNLYNCTMCILDEADRLLEMGFAQQIRSIMKSIPSESVCQKVLLSATMPKVLVDFTKGSTGSTGFCTIEPTMVRLDQDSTVSAELRIAFITCRSTDKDAALLHIMHHIEQDRIKHTIKTTKTTTKSKSNNTNKKGGRGGSRQKRTNDNDDDDDEHDVGGIEREETTTTSKDTISAIRTGLTIIFVATRHHVEYITTLLQASGYRDNVTMIYGTLDQEARKQNLYEFKTCKKQILVVTDVAARGIDVPYIDHVIHYHFPSSSKLFVHRSGRAARAGRIGFCWSLLEPDEIPYMIDLHLFLGRRLLTGPQAQYELEKEYKQQQQRQGGEDDQEETNTPSSTNHDTAKVSYKDDYMYTLDDMTPDMVHYGSLPESIACIEVENVQRIFNSELSSSIEAEALRSLTKVCINAMKQYRRTRPEPSKDAIRRAKAILEGERTITGQRIGNGGTIPPHPLLRYAELCLYNNNNNNINNNNTNLVAFSSTPLSGATSATSATATITTTSSSLTSIENIRAREAFLRTMANLRPKETVFEAFATGKSKDASVSSQIDKGRTTNTKRTNANRAVETSTAALAAMKQMRRQMRIAHDKGSTLIVAGSAAANATTTTATSSSSLKITNHVNTNGITTNDNDLEQHNHNTDHNSSNNNAQQQQYLSSNATILLLSTSSDDNNNNTTKRRISKAERRRLKNHHQQSESDMVDSSCDPSSNTATSRNDPTSTSCTTMTRPKKRMRNAEDFRDPMYFIDNDSSGIGDGTSPDNNISTTAASADSMEQQRRSRFIEASMQPNTSARNVKGTKGHALRLEEAMLDVVGDENEELIQRQRMIRWDKSKRKYVQTTIGSELNGTSRSKKTRLESGQLVKNQSLKLGELYEKWQKKTNRSIGRTGIFDNDTNDDTANDDDDHNHTNGNHHGRSNNNKFNNKTTKKKGNTRTTTITKGQKKTSTTDAIRSAVDIKKEREKKQNDKVKNMKRDDRRRLQNNKKGSKRNTSTSTSNSIATSKAAARSKSKLSSSSRRRR